jgi:hypothetical protein
VFGLGFFISLGFLLVLESVGFLLFLESVGFRVRVFIFLKDLGLGFFLRV